MHPPYDIHHRKLKNAWQVRLKRYIEMRGADGGPESHVLALPAFWVGLLYDNQAKAGVLELTRDWTLQEVEALRDDVRFDQPHFFHVPYSHQHAQ